MAQEVKRVLPEAVFSDANGSYSVSYTSLVPLLINAVKEQQQQIEAAKKENERAAIKAAAAAVKTEAVRKKNEDLKKRLVAIEKALKFKK